MALEKRIVLWSLVFRSFGYVMLLGQSVRSFVRELASLSSLLEL